MAEYDAAWRKLAHIRRTAALALLVWLIWIITEFFIDPEWVVTRQLVATFLLCVAFWSYAILYYLYWPCPRCGKPFQAGFIQGPWTAWPRTECKHCGLRVGS
jgi:DNA-directed RNA polymerase subunit RPC12/RpoP